VLCGHYEGVDQRVIDKFVDIEISIGDYVLTGGEIPTMVLVDCVARLVPGVLGNPESIKDESFSRGLLEYPQYTRPQEYEGYTVPEVLLSGNHREIERWRLKESLRNTLKKRPDLLKEAELLPHEIELLREIQQEMDVL
jgi:tRNA (guanine37-N1)-methyltransferase